MSNKRVSIRLRSCKFKFFFFVLCVLLVFSEFLSNSQDVLNMDLYFYTFSIRIVEINEKLNKKLRKRKKRYAALIISFAI